VAASRAPLDLFQPAVRDWFASSFGRPTAPQSLGWPPIARGDSTLILSPTGSGKTLAAFLWAINRVMFSPLPAPDRRCRVLYVSPLKALAVDVERNLRSPIAGVARAAQARGDDFLLPEIAVRTGDTPSAERERFRRNAADLLITTPESLYLLLTSRARDVLRAVETIIVDEIHSLVPTKRGAHLALSLERLQVLCRRPVQRIGLSATQRPLDEVARFLGGAEVPSHAGTTAVPDPRTLPDEPGNETSLHDEFNTGRGAPEYRPVTIIDARQPKRLVLNVEVPVEDLARLAKPIEIPSGPASQGPVAGSIWSSIHPRLLELIRSHRTTLLFANSRRLAERLAGAINELPAKPSPGRTTARSRASRGSRSRTR
jgi:ATP-dependent helicase Lhr and Lhr-like helicase